jgi:hypothetical protein
MKEKTTARKVTPKKRTPKKATTAFGVASADPSGATRWHFEKGR